MKNKKIVELMLILGVTAGLAGGCTQKTKEQSYVNITKNISYLIHLYTTFVCFFIPVLSTPALSECQLWKYKTPCRRFLQIDNPHHRSTASYCSAY